MLDFVKRGIEKYEILKASGRHTKDELDHTARFMVSDCTVRMAVLLANGSIGFEWYSANHKALMDTVGW